MKKIQTVNYYFKFNFSVCAMSLMIFSQVFNKAKCGTGIGDIEIPYVIAMLFVLLQLMNQKNLQIDFFDSLRVILWMLLAVASTLLSNVVQWNENGYSLLACMLFYLFVTNTAMNQSSIRTLLRIYSIIVLYISIQILYMCYSHYFSIYGDRYTITILGVDKDPNFLSAFMVPCLIYLCYASFCNPKINRLYMCLRFSIVLLIFFAIFNTGSRAAMLSILITTLLVFILKIFKEKKTTMILFIISISIFVVVINIFLMGSPLYERMFSIDSYTSNIRLLIWHDAIKAFFNNPIIGEGHLSGSYYVSLGVKGKWFGTHNCFLDIATGTGILGVVVLLSMFKSIINVKDENKVFVISLLVSSFIPLFFINGYDSMSFWLPMTLCKIISNKCKSEVFYGLL